MSLKLRMLVTIDFSDVLAEFNGFSDMYWFYSHHIKTLIEHIVHDIASQEGSNFEELDLVQVYQNTLRTSISNLVIEDLHHNIETLDRSNSLNESLEIEEKTIKLITDTILDKVEQKVKYLFPSGPIWEVPNPNGYLWFNDTLMFITNVMLKK